MKLNKGHENDIEFISFFFLTIRVMLQKQQFSQKIYSCWADKLLLILIWSHHCHYFFIHNSQLTKTNNCELYYDSKLMLVVKSNYHVHQNFNFNHIISINKKYKLNLFTMCLLILIGDAISRVTYLYPQYLGGVSVHIFYTYFYLNTTYVC